jgi:hypothetical protein
MHLLSILQAMALLTLANGTPVIGKKIFKSFLALPLDCGIRFFDGRPLFGSSKTIRGIILSIMVTAFGARLIGLDAGVGATAATAAMAGDLCSSFIKRRLNFAPSSQALGLDQIPESLLPLWACSTALALSIFDIALGVGLFFIGELVLSRFLYRVHLRDEPY